MKTRGIVIAKVNHEVPDSTLGAIKSNPGNDDMNVCGRFYLC